MKKTSFVGLSERKKFLYQQKARAYRAMEPIKNTDWVPFEKKLLESKIAFISVVGAYLKDQKPFTKQETNSDYDFRILGLDFDKEKLELQSLDWEPGEAQADLNVVFPIERLILLQKEGLIGKIHEEIYSFAGYSGKRELLQKSVSKMIRSLKESEVDGVLIIPTSCMTSEAACLIASQVEANGISTAVISHFYEQALVLSPPRCAFIDFPFGRTLGKAEHITLHTAILRDTLRLFEKAKSTEGVLLSLNFVWSFGDVPDW